MPLHSFDDLFNHADAGPPQPVVAAGGADVTVLEALTLAARRGWIEPIVTGNAATIRAVAEPAGLDIAGIRIIEADESSSAQAAVAEIQAGRAALLMKGRIATPALMKAVLDRDHGLRTGRVIAQVVLMEIGRDDRRFLMTDTGVTIAPTLEQKADLARHLIGVAEALGQPAPRIALMAATEKATEAMPDTLEAAQLAARSEKGEFVPGHLDGPLSFDLAYASDAAAKKGIASDVAGAADAMLFPNLLAANLAVKAIMYTADCRFGGVLRGTRVPVVFMSRADTTETRLCSLALSLCIARAEAD